MNIFLGVYACEPHKGSEPEVGWQMVNGIAKAMPEDNIYAITKDNNKEIIEAEGYPPNVNFFYFAPPKWLTFWKKGPRGVRMYYYIWLITAALFMKKQKIKFDIVHHVTFVNDWLPSFFYLLKTKENKFIWGPIGSNNSIDFKFYDNNKSKIQEIITNLLKNFYRNCDPFFHLCKLKADCIIGTNNNVKNKLKLRDNKCFKSEPAIALKESDISNILNSKNKTEIFTIVSVGNLVYIKNFKLTILAFSKFLKMNPWIVNTELQIIGEGKDKSNLISLAKELGVLKNIVFLGQMPREKVQEYFSKADIFLYPTLENAGFVILEAMSNSLPIVAMKYGGPEQFIKYNTSFQLVDATQDYDEIANLLAKRLEFFYTNRELCLQIGQKNKQTILDDFTWEKKVHKIKEIYRKILNEEIIDI